jgi:hypothetical protein
LGSHLQTLDVVHVEVTVGKAKRGEHRVLVLEEGMTGNVSDSGAIEVGLDRVDRGMRGAEHIGSLVYFGELLHFDVGQLQLRASDQDGLSFIDALET